MRSQTKATLKTKLQVEVSNRLTITPDAILIDVGALLWSVHWPSSRTVEDLYQNLYSKPYLLRTKVSFISDL